MWHSVIGSSPVYLWGDSGTAKKTERSLLFLSSSGLEGRFWFEDINFLLQLTLKKSLLIIIFFLLLIHKAASLTKFLSEVNGQALLDRHDSRKQERILLLVGCINSKCSKEIQHKSI